MEQVFQSIKQDFGTIHGLINNAGITNDGLSAEFITFGRAALAGALSLMYLFFSVEGNVICNISLMYDCDSSILGKAMSNSVISGFDVNVVLFFRSLKIFDHLAIGHLKLLLHMLKFKQSEKGEEIVQ